MSALAGFLTFLLVAVGAAVPASAAVGISGAYSGPISGSNSRTVSFTLNADGTVSGFETQTYVYCSGFPAAMYWIPSGPLAVAADGSFSGVWYSQQGEDTEVKFELSGSFTSSTTAQGTALATMPNLPSCAGGETVTWSAELTTPTYDPQLALSPSTFDLADGIEYVTMTLEGFAPEVGISILVDGVQTYTTGVNGSGSVTDQLFVADLAAGVHTVEARSSDGTQSATATLTVTSSVTATGSIELSPAVQASEYNNSLGTAVYLRGFRPNDGVSIKFEGSNFYTGSVNAEGGLAVNVPLSVVSGLPAGEYTIRAHTEDYFDDVSATYTITDETPATQFAFVPDTMTVEEYAANGAEGEIVWGGAHVPWDVYLGSQLVWGGETVGNGAVFAHITTAETGELAPGTYTFVAVPGDGRPSVSATLTITGDPVVHTPTLSVAPTSVTVSELASPGVTATLAGFPAGAQVTVSAGGVDTPVTTDANGAASVTLARTAAPGTLTVTASDGTHSATANVTVTADPVTYTPAITLDGTTTYSDLLAIAGVQVQGQGFPPNTDVTVTLDGTFAVAGTTDAGGIAMVRFYRSGVPAGTYEVVMTDGTHSASASLTVIESNPAPQPTLTLDPDSIFVVEMAEKGVTVTLGGFPAGASVTVSAAGTSQTVTVDANGAYSGVMRWPASPGTLTVTATDGTHTASADLTVRGGQPDGAMVGLIPRIVTAEVLSTQGVAFWLRNFEPNTVVHLSSPWGVTYALTNGEGNAMGTLVGAAHQHGDYEIIVSDGVNMVSTDLTVVDEHPLGPRVNASAPSVSSATLGSTGVPLTISGFPAGSQVNVAFGTRNIGAVTVNDDGEGTYQLVVPGAAVGQHTVTVSTQFTVPGLGMSRATQVVTWSATTTIEVTGSSSSGKEPAAQLPATGAPSVPLAALSVGSVALGFVLLIARRRFAAE